MKKIAYEAEFDDGQLCKIADLARSTELCEQTVRILFGRGIDTRDKIEAFLNPSKQRFLSPYLMSGMKQAVDLIKRARDEGWSVVVYGDYDADGVCATTIMQRALEDFGLDVVSYVPERKNGYGLNVNSIDEIFEEYFPQLFITVDCGISNAAEVEYIKEQGAEVIVTDHHELPDKLPDCICVNPKICDDYPYDNLCGAGVAFKVGCALNGKSAYGYLDFAAIATVADSVPLTGENRDLVAEGLKLINENPRPNYSGFFKSGEKVTAQTLAYTVAPKINAAGRMGDANAALRLFLSSDENEIYDYTVKLTTYNLERQKSCDEMYISARNKLREKGADGRVIVLWDEAWNSGFVGIVAARLAEEYCRPALLFVKNGNMLKGSVRSVDGVNVFEALKACGEYIVEFGGHAQAAGVNVEEDKLQLLEEALNAYFYEHYSKEAFSPTYYINGVATLPVPTKLIKELELIEPCGVGNRKPQFVFEANSCRTRALKPGLPHLAVKCDGLDMIYFSGLKYADIIQSSAPKSFIFEYSVSQFRGKEQIKGYIKDVIYRPESCAFAVNRINFNTVTLLSFKQTQCNVVPVDRERAQKMFDERSEYGTVFIVYNYNTLRLFGLRGIDVNMFTLSSGSLADVVLVSPSVGCDLSDFERVVFLDNPKKITLPSLAGKTVYVCTEIDGLKELAGLDADREELLAVFKYLSANRFAIKGACAEEAAEECGDFNGLQAFFALKVFEELGLIDFDSGRLNVNRGLKTQLGNSELYNLINSIGGAK